MSRFASKELRTIDLGNDEWVKIPVALSYKVVSEIEILSQNETEAAKKMLITCLKEWNLKDND